MLRRASKKIVIGLIWLFIWAAAAASVGQTLLLPSPFAVAASLWTMGSQSAFWLSACFSLLRVFLGFLLGLLLGCAIAGITCRWECGQAFLAPFLAIAKATPVASFILLALVWIRTDGVPIFATSVVVLPLVWANVSAGIHAVDPLLLEMAKAFRMRKQSMFTKLYWPTIRPYFKAALATGVGMAWKAGVAAEVICTPKLAVGSRLFDAKIYLETPALFANTVVVILLSILLENLVVYLADGKGKRKNA